MAIAATMRAAVMNAILLFFIFPPAPFVLLDSIRWRLEVFSNLHTIAIKKGMEQVTLLISICFEGLTRDAFFEGEAGAR
jgi:hypothetical protein